MTTAADRIAAGPRATAGTPPPARLQGLPPVVAPNARLLVLGSFPGAASLAAGQYYAHPRNQFWPLLSAIWGVDLAVLSYAARLDALRTRGLALWDVYASCEREGSLDSAIRGAERNDLGALRAVAPGLRLVAHNGGESARTMRLTAALGWPVVRLPSTSPANASWSFERKREAWAAALRDAGIA